MSVMIICLCTYLYLFWTRSHTFQLVLL